MTRESSPVGIVENRVRGFVEQVVGLVGLEGPCDRRGAAHHLVGPEGAAQRPRGAVLNQNLRVRVDIDPRTRGCD